MFLFTKISTVMSMELEVSLQFRDFYMTLQMDFIQYRRTNHGTGKSPVSSSLNIYFILFYFSYVLASTRYIWKYESRFFSYFAIYFLNTK